MSGTYIRYPSNSSSSSSGVGVDYGAGSDGAITLDGTATYPFFGKSGTVYYSLKPIYATTLAIQSGITLVSGPFRIFCSNSLTNAGVISNNGANGTVGSGGVGGGGGVYEWLANPSSALCLFDFNLGQIGAIGGNVNSNGTDGISSNTFYNFIGGGGGKGGSGTMNAATIGGTAANAGVSGLGLDLRSYNAMSGAIVFNSNGTLLPLNGGAPGASGGGGGIGVGAGSGGGGGGGGGGVITIYTKTFNNTGVIRANGGNGGPGENGAGVGDGGAGGGGGGGGGITFLFYSTLTSLGSISVSGGIGGTAGTGHVGGANGSAGISGSVGIVAQYNSATGVWS